MRNDKSVGERIDSHNRELVEVNLRKLRLLVHSSREYLFAQRGYSLDIFA